MSTRHTGRTPGTSEARFPGFDVLAQSTAWDEVTTGVVMARLGPPPVVAFFTPSEESTARALVDRLLGQDHPPRVPVLEEIDQRLLAGRGDGYRYEDMPPDGEAWKRSLAALDVDARSTIGAAFALIGPDDQMAIIEAVRLREGEWHGLPAARVYSLWMRYACAAFYSHPWAWNEIGFGGPAYPRGYVNLGIDRREHWERPERDATDPIPWARRAEAAKKAHAARLPDRSEP